MKLDGTLALVTGAAGGIGHHIVAALAERGARVLVSDISLEALDAAPLPEDATKLPADLRDMHACERLIERAGAIDVLVNCAGLEYTGAYAQQNRGEIEDLVRVNLLAPMMLTRVALPGMLERGRGHVVNIASIAGKGPTPYLTSYGATKAGLIGLTRGLRVEHKGTGVSFSAVAPGFVSEEGMYARMEGEAPVALGTTPPEKVAAAVVKVIERDLPEKIVAARPMRPLFALGELSPRLGELTIVGTGARRFLRRVGQRRGRA